MSFGSNLHIRSVPEGRLALTGQQQYPDGQLVISPVPSLADNDTGQLVISPIPSLGNRWEDWSDWGGTFHYHMML